MPYIKPLYVTQYKAIVKTVGLRGKYFFYGGVLYLFKIQLIDQYIVFFLFEIFCQI